MNYEYKESYVNPYEAYGHHTAYGFEERESYAKVHGAPNHSNTQKESRPVNHN